MITQAQSGQFPSSLIVSGTASNTTLVSDFVSRRGLYRPKEKVDVCDSRTSAEPPTKRQRSSIRGSGLSEAPGSVTSEVFPTIGSLEVRLDDSATESQASLDRIAESA